MILRLYLLALVVHKVLPAPTSSSQPQLSFDPWQNATNTRLLSQSTQYDFPSDTVPITPWPSSSVNSTSLSNLTDIPSSQPFSTAAATSFNTSFSVPPSLTSFALLPTSTIFVTEVATAFETTTVSATPSSTTIVTVVVTATATTFASPSLPSPSASWDNRTLWTAPLQMTDLSAFNVTYFPSGQKNLHIVAQIPPQHISPTAKFLSTPILPFPNTSILQLVYPAHSVNPGSKPEGGADFYATPLNLAGARNVTLDYSVFFPVDFDWVKGGKLPGLFGGHTGCSGGASARDCFSTRLMWRPQGVGELYLYAPKDKQTVALCGDVDSVCDATYGFSIGRGAFNFTAGDWTHLSQNVVLNTPGKNDGVFVLSVNGRLTINRTDIFYRSIAHQSENVESTLLEETEGVPRPTEFIGLFFSTFFGGHGKVYATPKQQYTWFKNFSIIRHD